MPFRTLEPIGDLPLTPPVGPDPEEYQCVVCKRWSYGRDMLDIDGEMICDDYDCLMELCRSRS